MAAGTGRIVMNVACGVNNEPWTEENPLFLCHHCGMPVCLKDGVTVGSDGAFDAAEEPVQRAAMHCPGCARTHHRSDRSWTNGWIDPKALQAEAKRAAAERDRARAAQGSS
jgi:hypothetical protein